MVYIDNRNGRMVCIYIPRAQMSDVKAGEMVVLELTVDGTNRVVKVVGKVSDVTSGIVRVISPPSIYRRFLAAMLKKHTLTLAGWRRYELVD